MTINNITWLLNDFITGIHSLSLYRLLIRLNNNCNSYDESALEKQSAGCQLGAKFESAYGKSRVCFILVCFLHLLLSFHAQTSCNIYGLPVSRLSIYLHATVAAGNWAAATATPATLATLAFATALETRKPLAAGRQRQINSQGYMPRPRPHTHYRPNAIASAVQKV